MNEATDRAQLEANHAEIDTPRAPAREEWVTPEVTKLALETAQLTAP